jgi:PAS domain S-box-containing protein
MNGNMGALMDSGPRHRSKVLTPRVPDSGLGPEVPRTKWVKLNGQLLLNAVPDAILMVNREGEIVVANVQAERLFGYEHEELIGRSVESLISPRLRAENRQHRENVFKDQYVQRTGGSSQLFVLRKDAAEVPVEISLNPLTNQAGVFLVCVIRDATDRRHSEGLKVLDAVLRETHESEERFRLLADTAPALIWMSDSDKLCIYVNKSWQGLNERSMDSEVGNGWSARIHPDDLRSCLDTYTQAFDRREEFRVEYRRRRRDEEYRWILDTGVPRFDKDRTFVGYIGIGVDVTDRKLAEAALARVSSKLIEAQEQERTRIARELHDDFSQRLALQCIDLEQLSKKLSESDTKERARVVGMLKRAKEMSADLHSLSHQLHSSKLEFVGLASAVRGLCKEISAKYEIDVHFKDSGMPPDIPKDVALCLFRVTQEALGNVFKHSGAKSAGVELGSNEAGLSLRIVDEGRGFDTRGDNAGFGIGLVGMTERLRLVGGRLSIRSELMRGTEILAEVPLFSSVKRLLVKTATVGGRQS